MFTSLCSLDHGLIVAISAFLVMVDCTLQTWSQYKPFLPYDTFVLSYFMTKKKKVVDTAVFKEFSDPLRVPLPGCLLVSYIDSVCM